MEVVDSDDAVTSIRGGAVAASNRPNTAGALMKATAARHNIRTRTDAELIAVKRNFEFDGKLGVGDSSLEIGTTRTSCLSITLAGAQQVIL